MVPKASRRRSNRSFLVASLGAALVVSCGSSATTTVGNDGGADGTPPTREAGPKDTGLDRSHPVTDAASSHDASSHHDVAVDTGEPSRPDAAEETGPVEAAVHASHDAGHEAGPACAPSCPDGNACSEGSQCASGVCTNGTCAAPACSPSCPDGNTCTEGSQCASGVCTNGTCAAPACSHSCPAGNVCGAATDCASGVCTDGTCAPPACSPSCPVGNVCGAATDCVTEVCTSGVCASPACSPSCSDGSPCGANDDCESDVCMNGKCAAPTCSPSCPDGNVCGAATDCASGLCTAGKCVAPACSPSCSVNQACGANSDCASGVCTAGVCTSGLPTTGLIAYWNFEQASPTVTDVSGNGNNGTNFGATQGAGKIGQGYTFKDGECIGVPNSTSLSMVGGAAVSIMAWANYAGGCDSSDHGEILNKENTYEFGPACNASNALQDAIQTNTGGVWTWAGTPTVRTTAWHLYTVTWDGATALEYVDGVQGSTRAITGALVAEGTGLGIGCRGVSANGSTTGTTAYFIGSIDEVSVYGRALTPAEITKYYNATK